MRWAIVWLPLLVPMALVGLLMTRIGPAAAWVLAVAVLAMWMGAGIYTVVRPNRGLHDRLVGTWVVRR
jgi:uncharacterized RDD family membrane protein YckC